MTTATTDAEIGLTIDAAAEKLGIHPRTLRRYVSDGRLSTVRYTSQIVRISHQEMDRFLADNLKVVNGTGVCYVPRQPPEQPVKPKKAARVSPRIGRHT